MGASVSAGGRSGACDVGAAFAYAALDFETDGTGTGNVTACTGCPTDTGPPAWVLVPTPTPPCDATIGTQVDVVLPTAPSFEDRTYGFGVYVAMPQDVTAVDLRLSVHTLVPDADPDDHVVVLFPYEGPGAAGNTWLASPQWTVVVGGPSHLTITRLVGSSSPSSTPPPTPTTTVLYVYGVVTITPVIPMYPGAFLSVGTTGGCAVQAMKVRLGGLAPGPAPPTGPVSVKAVLQCQDVEDDADETRAGSCHRPRQQTVVQVSWSPPDVPMVNQTGWVVTPIGSCTAGFPGATTVPPATFSATIVVPKPPPGHALTLPQFVVYGVGLDGTRTPYSAPSWQLCREPCGPGHHAKTERHVVRHVVRPRAFKM